MIRLRPALLATWIAGAIAWALAMGGTATLGLLLEGWQTPESVRRVAVVYAAGGLIAFIPALMLARLFVRDGSRQRSFAAALFFLGVGTTGATALVFGLLYRAYYAQWHADFPSIEWGFELAFTLAGAFYQFAVSGMPLFLPLGLAPLFAVALLHARQAR